MRLLTVTGLCVMTGCATFEAGAPEGAVDVIAHRGASAYAPENTLAAFRLAAEMGAHWFELDCTLSKDGEVIVIHDDDLERTTDGEGLVADLTLPELKRTDAGSWFDPRFAGERLPTLGEALDFARGRIGVYIEIKDSDDDSGLEGDLLELAGEGGRLLPKRKTEVMRHIEASGSRNLALTRKVISEVRARRMGKQVVIQSFSPVVCAVSLIEAPELRTELLASSDDKHPGQWARFLRWAELLDPHGFNPNKKDVTPELVGDLHHLGKSIAVWTVNDEANMRRLTGWGVDGLITDRPDVALRVTRK